MQYFGELQQLFALAFHQLGNGNTGPAGNDFCYLLVGNSITQQSSLALCRFFFLFGKLLLQRGENAVFELRREVQIIAALGGFYLGVSLLDFLFYAANA